MEVFNDYVRGAFEALSWIESLIHDLKSSPEGWKILTREVDNAIVDIKRGVGVDFRSRLRSTA